MKKIDQELYKLYLSFSEASKFVVGPLFLDRQFQWWEVLPQVWEEDHGWEALFLARVQLDRPEWKCPLINLSMQDRPRQIGMLPMRTHIHPLRALSLQGSQKGEPCIERILPHPRLGIGITHTEKVLCPHYQSLLVLQKGEHSIEKNYLLQPPGKEAHHPGADLIGMILPQATMVTEKILCLLLLSKEDTEIIPSLLSLSPGATEKNLCPHPQVVGTGL